MKGGRELSLLSVLSDIMAQARLRDYGSIRADGAPRESPPPQAWGLCDSAGPSPDKCLTLFSVVIVMAVPPHLCSCVSAGPFSLRIFGWGGEGGSFPVALMVRDGNATSQRVGLRSVRHLRAVN